jgi:hypothetical protein
MKYFLIVLAFILGLFASHYIFNDVNVWLGWIAYIATIGLTLRYVIKKLISLAKGDQTKVDSKKN